MVKTPEEISKVLLKIVDKTTEPFRKKLDANLHLLDFSYSALKISDASLTPQDYTKLCEAIKASSVFRKSVSIKDSFSRIKDPNVVSGYTVFIEDPRYGTYILARDYSKIQSRLSTILKTIDHGTSLVKVDQQGVLQANIGHISSSFLDSTRTPLSAMLYNIASKLPVESANVVMQEVFKLQSAHNFEASYSFQRENFDLTGFNKILGKSTILVTLQSFKVNNTLATTVESAIIRNVRKYLQSQEFVDHILKSKGSLSIEQEFDKLLVAVLEGKSFKSSHGKKSLSTSKDIVRSSSSLKTTKPATSIRTNTGQFYSLANLQVLLNTQLQNVISANMGDEGYPGGQRRILNYRTGRFASSVQVERLSVSKENAITAFYRYMKNPYQTFEPGYLQGSPKTRDPKLLIAQSIREIAATKVSNRMRAVLI